MKNLTFLGNALLIYQLYRTVYTHASSVAVGYGNVIGPPLSVEKRLKPTDFGDALTYPLE